MPVHKFNYQVITHTSLFYEPWVTGAKHPDSEESQQYREVVSDQFREKMEPGPIIFHVSGLFSVIPALLLIKFSIISPFFRVPSRREREHLEL